MFSSISHGWDIGPVGIIYTTKEQMEIMGYQDATNEKIKEILEREVELYSYSLEGLVYRFNVEWIDKDGELQEDSCGSFLVQQKILDWLMNWLVSLVFLVKPI